MRVLFVASDSVPHTGGKSTHIEDLMDGMSVLGTKTDLLSFATLSPVQRRLLKLRYAHLRYLNHDLFKEKVSLHWGKRLGRLVSRKLLENDYDTVSFQDAVAATSSADAVASVEVATVLTMHTYFGVEYSLDGGLSVHGAQYLRRLDRELRALDLVDGVVTVDDRIRAHVVEAWEQRSSGHHVDRVRSIGNFTDTSQYSPPTSLEREKCRSSFGVGSSKFMVSCVRRLVEKNGVVNAVEAMRLIPDPDIVLMIAGDGPQRKDLERRVGLYNLGDRVKFLGALSREDTLNLLKASDASVVPSITVGGLQEATSIAAVEAMSCGIPVIVSKIGGLTELVDGARTGLLVNEGDKEELKVAIMRLFGDADLRDRLARGARSFIQEKHSHVGAAQNYLRTFLDFSRRGTSGS